MTSLGKSFVYASALFSLSAGCADFEPVSSDHYLLVTAATEVDSATCGKERVANGACQVRLDLLFPDGTEAGKTVKLRTTLGALVSSQGKVADGELSVTTDAHENGQSQTAVGFLIAPTEPGKAHVTASAESLLASTDVDFGKAVASSLELSATLRTFTASSAHSSDLSVLLGSDVGLPSTAAVHFGSCCPDLRDEMDCSRLVSLPNVLSTTTAEPTKLTLQARLTAEGDNYLAQPVEKSDKLSIYVVANLDDQFTCPSGALPQPNHTTDVVELRLVRDPPKSAP